MTIREDSSVSNLRGRAAPETPPPLSLSEVHAPQGNYPLAGHAPRITPARNCHQEIGAKLSELGSARLALARTLLPAAENVYIEIRSTIERSGFLTSEDIAQLYLKLPEDIRPNFSEYYRGSLRELTALQHQLRELVTLRNSDFALTRRVCHERAGRVSAAKAFLQTQDRVVVNFFVEGVGWATGGVVGRAMLMIEGLLHELPNAHIHVYCSEEGLNAADAAFGSPSQTRLTIHPARTAAASASEPHDADLVVAVAGFYSPYTSPCSPDITLYPFAYTQGLSSIKQFATSHEITPSLHDSPVCNDLHSPFGTVILDPSLLSARRERDGWDRATFTDARAKWRASVIKPQMNSALESLADREGWRVDEAIWSVCYLRDESKFAREMCTLTSVVRDDPSALLTPGTSSPPHILIHALVQSWDAPERWLPQARELGIRIISADTFESELSQSQTACRITIVAHNSIDNIFMRQAFAQLVGCPVRDSSDTYWIDFPVYVTGSASWLEALSAGGMPLHDGEDVSAGTKENQLAALAIKQRILKGEDLFEQSWTGLHTGAYHHIAVDMVGGDTSGERYRHLERYSAEARARSRSLYQLNSVDDVIITLASMLRDRGVAAGNSTGK